ncbi:MAG: Structural maintenance of chromosomes protein 6 [Bathelium mastoideum]|nr:MAG: Structural maintenance of chromosomes protein 6 [Bathelium mastoideum]
MAPVPQRRRREETDNSTLVSVETASSSLRQHPSKRPRLSTSTPGLDSESEYGRESREVTVYEDEPFTAQDHETRRDAGLVEETQNQDKDDFRSTQLVRQHFEAARENKPAENGIIEQVACHNFMCHRKLEVKFGPLINFIIGHNGSGKSAVLTALTLCLGGKATSTNRGQNLKSFIKEGEDACMLSVKLKNHGETGYRPELYGDSIIIERHISRAGTSGFKLKSASGRVISTKRYDLDEISDHFALQLDNPMNVLTQDMARQFLNNSSASEKYRFFVKGTQLEQLDNDYLMIEQYADTIEDKISKRQESNDILEQRYKQAETKRKTAERNESLNDKIRELGRQMAWTQVEEQEQELVSIENQIVTAETKIEHRTTEAETYSASFETALQDHERVKGALANLKDEVRPYEDRLAEVNEKLNTAKDTLINHQTQERNINTSLRGAKAQIEKFKRDIEKEKQRLEDQNGGEHARKLEKVQEAKEHAEALQRERDAHKTGHAALLRRRDEAQHQYNEALPAVTEKRQAVDKAEKVLQALGRNQGQQNGAYDAKLPALLRAIQAESRFRDRPIGPIGQHVRLKQSKIEWSSILETVFGQTLSSFVVTNKADLALLNNISRQVKCPCPVFIGDSQPLNISNTQPDPEHDTILRILEIQSDLVRNQLIINHAIEQTVLIKDQDQAFDYINRNPQGRARNTKSCIAFNVNRRGHGIRYSKTGTSAKMDPVTPSDRATRLQTDNEAQKRHQEAMIQHLRTEHAQAQSKIQELENARQTASQNVTQYENHEKGLRLNHQRADEEYEVLRDELEQDTPQDGKLDELRSQLANTEEESQQLSTDYQNAIIEKDKINAEQRLSKEGLAEIQVQIDEIQFKINKNEAKEKKLGKKREDALHEKNQAFEMIKDAENDKEKLEQNRSEQEVKISDWAEQASRISARVPVPPGLSADDLDRRLQKMHSDLQTYRQQQGGSLDELTLATAHARKRWTDAVRQLDGLLKTASLLKQTMCNRRNRWIEFRRFISSRARANFTYLLSERAFRGHLRLDHSSRLLDLSVEPDITRASDRGRQTKTLSGGEKSFSTICLLLSIWEAMGSPIRCLDEFDVFMDNVNRDVSMKMMINAARRSVGRQFVLITPQAMGNVDGAEDVRIHKMRDPERGQTTISFGNGAG